MGIIGYICERLLSSPPKPVRPKIDHRAPFRPVDDGSLLSYVHQYMRHHGITPELDDKGVPINIDMFLVKRRNTHLPRLNPEMFAAEWDPIRKRKDAPLRERLEELRLHPERRRTTRHILAEEDYYRGETQNS